MSAEGTGKCIGLLSLYSAEELAILPSGNVLMHMFINCYLIMTRIVALCNSQ